MRGLTRGILAVVFWALSMGAGADPDKPRVFQTSPVFSASDGVTEDGAAWLKRSKDRVDGRIMATVDMLGSPYSVWWIIFNNPAACATTPCGFDDLLDEDVGAAVFNASGAISAADGTGSAVINLDISVIGGEGAGSGSQIAPDFFPFNDFLAPVFERVLEKNNGRCAEIHLDINEHVMDTDWVFELTNPEAPQSFAVFLAAPDCN
jgi:hypothetical protein